MPVRTKTNKSAEIRKIHASGARSAADIVAKLKSRGIKVTSALVYSVLSAKKGKQRQRRQQAAPLAVKADVLDHAVVFVRSAGGMQKAREMLSKLALLHN